MNVVDLIAVLLVLVLGLRGLRRGGVRELFSFLGWVGGAAAAVWLLFDLTPAVARIFELPAAVAGLVVFVGVFVSVSTAIWLLGWLLSSLVRVTVVLRPVDRSFGFALGAVEGLVLAGIFFAVFRESPLFPAAREQVDRSAIGSWIADHVAAAFAAVRADAFARREERRKAAGEGAEPRPKPSPAPRTRRD